MQSDLVYPRETVTEIISEIGHCTSTIWAKHPDRREDFREIVKSLRLWWDWDRRRWQRNIGVLAGETQDRAAELGHHLLNGGFPLRFLNEELRDKAIAGDYEQECRRWLLTGKDSFDGWFRFWWGREFDLYDAARAISGSRYDRETKCVVIPQVAFDEVQDFVERFEFQIHSQAKVLLRQAKKQRQQAYIVDVTPLSRNGKISLGRPHLKAESGKVDPQFCDYGRVDFDVTTELLPHQVPAVKMLQGLILGGFFMDMGTGKTRCAIQLVYLRQARISQVVWFCPCTLKITTLKELLKHTTLDESQIYVFDDETTPDTLPDVPIYIIGIESMSSSDRVVVAVAGLIDEHSMVVVDESGYIKTHNALRTQRITSLAEKARYHLIMTGTPISQGVEDLFAQMRFLSPKILGYGSFYSFAANHLEYSEKYPDMVVRAHNVPWLTSKIAPYVYQVTKEDAGLNLPEKLYESRYYQLTNEQRYWYERAKDEILMELYDDDLSSVAIFKLFGALQQIVSGFWNYNGSRIEIEHNRIETLLNVVSEIGQNEKVIVWCKFVHSVQEIDKALQNAYGDGCVSLYYGALNERERNESLARFRDDARFLVATMATGGHGLTLVESAWTTFYENSFKYASRIQAEDRNHRIGQERRPTYIDIYADCGIEKRIADAIARKENVVAAFKREMDRSKNKTELAKVL